MKRKKVIIVGAGPGGLVAALLLAHHGYQVIVYEKQPYIGGRNGALRTDGFTFDLGPTFFMMKHVLEEIFAATGRRLSDYVKLTELDPMYRLVFSGGRSFFPSRNREYMREQIEKLFPGNSAGYERYLAREKRKYDMLIPCLQVPYNSPADLLSPRFLRSVPHLDAHVSLYDVLGRYFKHDDLKTAFTFQAKYIGMSPWAAPGTFSIISYIEHGGGIYHVEGGLWRLCDALAAALKEEGGELRLGCPVGRIVVENRSARGVELTDGTREAADYTVINADFAHAMTTLVDQSHRPRYTDQKLKKKLYSCSTFMLYLGVKKRYDSLAHHNIVFADDYRKNVQEITGAKVLSSDPSFYVQNASVTDPTLAPEGMSALYVLVPVPNNTSGIDWQQARNPLRAQVLNLLESRAGFAGLQQNLVAETIITPQKWETQKAVYTGATFNLGHNIGQMLLFRPHNQFEEFDRCYLVGGGTHPGSGLPTIYESGRISAGLIMSRDGLK